MKRWVLAAGLLAALVAPQAMAADLDDGGPPPWRGGAYGYPHQGIPPPPPSYYNGDDDDDGPPHAKKYSGVPPYSSGPYGSCVRSEQVRDRLTSLGWRDFHSGKAASESTVTLRARRPGGRLYELRLDRCSGEILATRPLEFPQPYAFRESDEPYGPRSRTPYAYGNPYGYGPYAYGGPYAYSQKWRDRQWYGGSRRWDSD